MVKLVGMGMVKLVEWAARLVACPLASQYTKILNGQTTAEE